jgi:hypothetical protein
MPRSFSRLKANKGARTPAIFFSGDKIMGKMTNDE